MNLIDNGITQHGTEVTLKTVIVTDSQDVYGTATQTYTESSIDVMIGAPVKNDRMLVMGFIGSGDMVATVKSTQAIKEGDILVYDSVDWVVVNVAVIDYKNITSHKRVGLKQVP